VLTGPGQSTNPLRLSALVAKQQKQKFTYGVDFATIFLIFEKPYPPGDGPPKLTKAVSQD
jgi:hypothetical protein